jgi:hypothetical protein
MLPIYITISIPFFMGRVEKFFPVNIPVLLMRLCRPIYGKSLTCRSSAILFGALSKLDRGQRPPPRRVVVTAKLCPSRSGAVPLQNSKRVSEVHSTSAHLAAKPHRKIYSKEIFFLPDP